MADPMLDYTPKYSVNTFVGNGSTTVWNLSLAGGYLEQAHVKAYSTDPSGVDTDRAMTWLGAAQVQISPAIPSGHTLTIYRDTPKDAPEVDFVDGAIVNEPNLDLLAKQAVFVSAEVLDRLGTVNDRSVEALENSEAAITIAQATVGGDFTLFARTNLPNTWTAAQNLPTGTTINSAAIATQSYVTIQLGPYATTASVATSISGSLASYTPTATMNNAIATAKAEAIAAAVAADAVLLANAELDWLYTLASR